MSESGTWRSAILRQLSRWIVPSLVGVTVTLVLLAVMMRLSSGSWILEAVIRVFPLTQTPLVDPCEAVEPLQTLVSIDGIVGYYAGTDFVPRPDAEIIGTHGEGDGQRVPVSAEGIFRFVTPFPEPRPSECAAAEATEGAEEENALERAVTQRRDAPAKRLIVRAPGCVTRSVPIVRAWIPHRILLECD